MKHIRIAGGDSFKLGAAMGVPLILAMVGAASRLADAASASPTAGVTPDKVKAALPELEKLVKDTLMKPGFRHRRGWNGLHSARGGGAPEIFNTDPGSRFWKPWGNNHSITIVAHMFNPYVPAVHMNLRYLRTNRAWFGGGSDLAPTFT